MKKRKLVVDNQFQQKPSKQKIRLDNLKTIHPMTDNQKFAFQEYSQNQHLFLHGVAGTGKTFIALYLALKEILTHGSYTEKVIILKSMVPVRDIGFLKGTLAEKIEPYESPFIEMCNELFPDIENPYQKLKESGLIEFRCTSFLRGISLHNSIVIVDEFQDCTFRELDMIFTRIGDNSKLILSGDSYQNDLIKGEKSGFESMLTIVSNMEEFTRVEFTIDDIVRSSFVKNYITSRVKMGL